MPRLKLMTWNLRTFGSNTTQNDLDQIAAVINGEGVDVVCIQEIQVGNAANRVGAPIDSAIRRQLDALRASLQNQLNQTLGRFYSAWKYDVSGANKGLAWGLWAGDSNSMRDAYAVFWLKKPADIPGRNNHFNSISLERLDILDLDQNANLRWPGRRPGIAVLLLDHASIPNGMNVNIVSLHAATNRAAHPNASDSIRFLPRLSEVGGAFIPQVGVNGWQVLPPPRTPTIVLGDFNHNPGASYDGLINAGNSSYYSLGLNQGSTVYRTAQHNPPPLPNSIAPVNLTGSLYDNILHQQTYRQGAPHRITPVAPSSAVDFISTSMQASVNLLGGDTDLNRRAAFASLYKQQHMPTGLSDHLPVVQEFDIQ